jgi:hypothetical protein
MSDERDGYRKPSGLGDDMGGVDGAPDARMAAVLELLREAPVGDATTVLDVGIGGARSRSSWRAKGSASPGRDWRSEPAGPTWLG